MGSPKTSALMITVVDSKNDIQLDSASKKVSLREQEVLQKISEGYTVKEIASALYLSEHTIISHKKNLTKKLSAKNCVDLTVKAIKMGLVII